MTTMAPQIPPDIRAHIETKVSGVAAAHGVVVLFAAESGSRAWGFGSPDSDFDVRFIYAHPRDWYLRLVDGRDVIEEGIDDKLIDLNGWDVRKALRLLLKSNPALYEWLVSPIVYADDARFRVAAAHLFRAHASRRALAHHYWSIARTQWKNEIDGRTDVKLKKYFYVIRPLLSLGWVAGEAGPPPMNIGALLDAVAIPADLRAAIDHLLATKIATPELGLGDRIPTIDRWVRNRLEEWQPDRLDLPTEFDTGAAAAADDLFRATIGA